MPRRRGRLGRHHQHVRHPRDAGDRREVADRVVRHLGVQPRVDGVRGDRAHHDRRAVGRGLGGDVGAEVAAGAGPVVDEDDAEAVLDLLGQRAGDDVERAAGRIGHDEAERLALRQRAARTARPATAAPSAPIAWRRLIGAPSRWFACSRLAKQDRLDPAVAARGRHLREAVLLFAGEDAPRRCGRASACRRRRRAAGAAP